MVPTADTSRKRGLKMLNKIANAQVWYEQNEVMVYAFVIGACVLFGGVLVLIKKLNIPLHGEASFATPYAIRKAGLLGDDGIIVGQTRGSYLRFAGSEHCFLSAPTRDGKGVSTVVPNALAWPDSLVCMDIKLENHAITSKHRHASLRQDTFLYNPFSPTTHRQNVLHYVSNDPARRVTDVYSLGYIMYPENTNSANSIWSDGARSLFVSLCLYLLETDKASATFGNVLRHGSGMGQSLKDHATAILEKHELSIACADGLNEFINTPDVTAGGIVKNMLAALSLWRDPIIDNATSVNDFDVRTLRQKRQSVYVGIPTDKIASAGPLLRLFFAQLINQNIGTLPTNDKNNVPVLIVLDEFMAIPALQVLSKGSGYIAGYGMRLLLIAQSKAQVTAALMEGGYGRDAAKAMLDNIRCKVYFAPEDQDDANELSDLLGYNTVKSVSRQTRNRWQGTESDQRRALMLPQELRDLGDNKQIIRIRKVRPIMCRKIFYYKERPFIDCLKAVAPSLAALGRKLPNEEQLKAAWSSGELAAPVPTHVIRTSTVKPKKQAAKKVADKPKQTAGVDLNTLAIELPVIDKQPATDAQRTEYANQVWDCIAADTTTTPDQSGVDTSTGEVINMNLLKRISA